MQPLVSIVVPNYNHATYLPKAIHSILAQDYKNFELILIEDGSTDNSLEIIRSFCERDHRIKLIKHGENRGVYYSMNEGLEAALGKYIHFLGADDFYMPRFLSTALHHLLKDPEIGISACDSYYYLNSPEYLHLLPFAPDVKKAGTLKPNRVARLMQHTFLKFSGTNSIVKTSLIKEYGGFNSKFNASCDWIVLTKIALSQGAIYIPEPLVCWKKNTSGVCAGVLQNKKLRQAMYANILEDLSDCPKSLFKQFKISGELGCVIKYAPLEFFKRPKFWSFFSPILKRFILRKWRIGVMHLLRRNHFQKCK